MGVRSIFPEGGTSEFSKRFSWGETKVVKFVFLPLENKKTAVFAEIFKFLPPFRHPCLCVGRKFVPHDQKLV